MACPFCGSLNVHRFPNGKIFKCREKQCRQKFSVTAGTKTAALTLPNYRFWKTGNAILIFLP
jgi:ribosomal protein L37AE/L43A